MNTRARVTAIPALIAAGRRRVQDRFGIALEPEVQLLGDAGFPFEAQE